jgi:uncharacterized protein (DUF983 family)
MSTAVKTSLGRIVRCKCPVCGEGHLFENESLYTFDRLGQVKKRCTVCDADFNPEPGFYFGAAYVSWGLTVALWISVLVALKTFNWFGWIEFGFLTHPLTFLITGFSLSVVLFPYMFQLSRSMWANWFVKGVNSEE